MYTPELQQKMSIWRQRASEGVITPDEMREAILALREDRKAAIEASSAKKSSSSRSKAPAKSADDLLGELDAL